ncbi:hypothetical protein LCGC14_3154100, partial [marine sediment metagenome]
IATGDRGQTLWETTAARDLPDEIWDDWSLGLGETKQETGRGYLFARGWDESTRGASRLSPFFHNLNNTALTTAYGYFMEAVETSGSTLTFDASTSTTEATASPVTFSHTVASQSERILMVAVLASQTSHPASVTYAGAAMTQLSSKNESGSTNDIALSVWFLLNPATGANTVSVDHSVHNGIVVGASSFYGVNLDVPFGTVVTAEADSLSPSATVTTASGEIVFDAVGVDTDRTLTVGANQTEDWDANLSAEKVTGGSSHQAGADGGAMTWTISGSGTPQWISIAVPIKPSSTTSRSVMQIADTTKIFRYTYDSDTGLTLDATDTTASGVAGRPA